MRLGRELAETKLELDAGQYVKAGDLTVYYETFGSGEPLVLLHGGGINARGNWESFVPTLSKHFKVFTPDSRGHGKTDNPKGELGFRLMADDVARLIQALQLEKPGICGYSDGGQICLELGMNHPDIARRLVIIGAHNHMTAEDLAGLKGMGIEGPGRVDFQQVEKADPQLVSRIRQFSATHDPEYWKTFMTQISKMWLTRLNYTKEDYRKITVPTLILTGDRDDFVSLDDALKMYRSIPKSELAVMPGADHYFLWSKTELFTKTVVDFLQRQSPSK